MHSHDPNTTTLPETVRAADVLAARLQDTMQHAPVAVMARIQAVLDNTKSGGMGFEFVAGVTAYLANRDRTGLRLRLRDEAAAFGASCVIRDTQGIPSDPITDAARNLCMALVFLARVDHHPFRNPQGNAAAVAMAHESITRARLAWGVAV